MTARQDTDPKPTLELDPEVRRTWLEAFSDFALDHLDMLPGKPSCGIVGAAGHALAEELSVPIPERPIEGGVEAVIDLLDRLSNASLNTPGAGYLAYVPGGGLFAAAIADLVANVTNRYTGISAAAPGFCRLEADVLRWLALEFGYDSDARGLLTSGGSLANFAAIVTARHAHFGDSGDYSQSLAYTSSQAHHSIAKSLRLAGIPAKNLRSVDVIDDFSMSTAALESKIRNDREAGFKPFLVVAAAGTTNTGAVDDLQALARLCSQEDIWLHVDGAYGGAFVFCERGRRRLRGIELADSVTFDPHKGMFLPYGTGCLLVRDGEALRRAHQLDADYLQDLEMGGAPSPADYGPELSRDFRGLRLWLPLMLHGAQAFREALSEKLSLADRFHEGLLARIEAGAELEVVAAPQLSAVAFRLRRRDGEGLVQYNQRNSALQDAINRNDRVYLSSTMLPSPEGAIFTLRICVLGFRTHSKQIEHCLADLDAALLAMDQ